MIFFYKKVYWIKSYLYYRRELSSPRKLPLYFIKHCTKWSFPLRLSSVNVSKSAGNYGFGQTYWRNPWWKSSYFVQWSHLKEILRIVALPSGSAIVLALCLGWLQKSSIKNNQTDAKINKRKHPKEIFAML